MKAKVFFFTIIFAFSQLSFGNDFSGLEQKTSIDEQSTDTLYIFISGVRYVNGVLTSFPPELVFTGEDIISFNIKTREIVLTNSAYKKFVPNDNLWQLSRVSFYLNNKLLFNNVRIVDDSYYNAINNLVFYFYCPDIKCRIYLNDSYPLILDYWPEEIREIYIKERDDNAEKRKAEWDIFIQYLSDTGKIVGNATGLMPVATPEIDDISIYPNPTTGELRMENGEWRMENVEVFDIYGIKQFSIFNFQFSTQIDISHLPAGIYFVRITTEKGVVTKKVVKR